MLRLPGCCPENYDPQTGACRLCGFTYDPTAWAAECHRRAHTPRTSQAADALPGQFLFPGLPQATPATSAARPPVPPAGERHCLYCGTLFPYHRATAEYCSPGCRSRAGRARARAAKACGHCGAPNQAPYCNDHCRWQDAKSGRLMRLGGRSER